MRRAGAYYYIDWMTPEIFFQELYRWTYPEAPRVGDEEIAPDEKQRLLEKCLFLRVDRIDLIASPFGGRFFPEQTSVCAVWFEDMPPDDFRLLRYLVGECPVHGQQFRVGRGVDDRLPALCRQIFREFHPSLHTGTSCRRPIIRYDQCPFHYSDRQM